MRTPGELTKTTEASTNGSANNGVALDSVPVIRIPTGRSPERTAIEVTGDLSAMTEEAWDALQLANQPPTLFRFGGVPARIEKDDDQSPIVKIMTEARMRHRLAVDADWLSVKRDKMVIVHPPVA